MSVDGEMYTVRQGDSISSLAFRYGLFRDTIWDHPKNKSLKELRKTPNVLKRGDEVFIPAKQPREEQGAADRRHRFTRKGVPEKLHVQFFDYDGEPLANKPYELNMNGMFKKGKLDGQGWLKATVPPDTSTVNILIGEKDNVVPYQLNVGHLDPVSEVSGVQARLRHLGYYDGPVDGVNSDNLMRAVAQFRQEEGLSAGSEIDDDFRQKLKERHFS